jgi:hypothetical protein
VFSEVRGDGFVESTGLSRRDPGEEQETNQDAWPVPKVSPARAFVASGRWIVPGGRDVFVDWIETGDEIVGGAQRGARRENEQLG